MRTHTRTAPLLASIPMILLGACHSTENRSHPAAQESAAAQPASPPPPADSPRKEVQAAYEPRSEPGAGQKLLEQMAGEWDVVKTFYPRNGGEPGITKGTCIQKMIQGGRFLESDFTFADPKGETTGTGIIGFDAQTGKFTSFWIDSRSTRFSVRQSEEPFDGAQITLAGKTIGEPGPNDRKSRTVSLLQDDGRTLIHRQWSLAADGSQRLIMQMVMTRR